MTEKNTELISAIDVEKFFNFIIYNYMKNCYSILGVTPDSSDAEIKSAYRNLARRFHPDVNPSGTQRFKDITEAYDVLSNPQKRHQYDMINGFFKSGPQTKTSSGKAQSEYKKQTSSETKKTSSAGHTPPNPSKEEFSKKINDIFEEFAKPKKTKQTPKKGEDIYEDISITIKEAVNGSERIINVMHTTQCPHCKGRKFINGNICNVCKGSGEKSEHKKITVKIPKNVKNGTKLRIPQEGNIGLNGGKNGDLYLKIKIEPNSRMKFEGQDVFYNVPITPFEAVLGGEINIPAFEGNLSLKIPPKTHSGQKFRLAGQGLKQNNKSGDMIVTVHIEIPCSLSDDEIRLYEKLKKLSVQNIRENLLNE